MYFCWFEHISPAFANIMLGVVFLVRIIIIEDTVYKCSEMVYQKLTEKQKEINEDPEGYKREMELQNLIDEVKSNLKIVGVVEFDFRL